MVHAYRVYAVRVACEGYENFRRHATEPLDLAVLAIELRGQAIYGELSGPTPIVRELFAADARIQQIEIRYRPKSDAATYRSSYLSAAPSQTRNWLVRRGDDVSDKTFESWGKKLPQNTACRARRSNWQSARAAPRRRTQRNAHRVAMGADR